MDSKIKPDNLKGDQIRTFTGKTDVETEAPVFWSSDSNRWLIGKTPVAGKDWGQKEKRASEDEMAGWHHWCNEHELGQTLEDGEGQGSLLWCNPWGLKELDTTGWLNNDNIALCYTMLQDYSIIYIEYNLTLFFSLNNIFLCHNIERISICRYIIENGHSFTI